MDLEDIPPIMRFLEITFSALMGVVVGIKSWCKEFSERQRMEIDFTNEVSSTLPFEVGLFLFRVLQEALHNAQKHSGVERIEVQLREDSGEIHLVVSDLGRGFDLETAMQGRGLGLTSMQGRVRLVNGTIEIDSKPMGGTTIHVRVPRESKHAAKREAVQTSSKVLDHVRLCVPRRLVRALRCFPHSQTYFENIRTEHLLRNFVRFHPTCVRA